MPVSRMGPTFLSVRRGHSSGCQSSPGWGDGVPPPPWEGRVHLEQEEGRGGGEAAGISWCPVSAEIMGDEAEGYRRGRPSTGQVEHSSLACILCPRNTALCPGGGRGENEIAGSGELPSPPSQRDRGGGQAWRRKGSPHIPHLPTQKCQPRSLISCQAHISLESE